MLVKRGMFYYMCIENEDVSMNIKEWECRFGLESYGKKSIVNLMLPDNNEGLNLKSI